MMKRFTMPAGEMWLPDDDHPMNRLRSEGRYEEFKVGIIASHLRPGDVFVDVGANLGYHSLYALSAGAYVWAFEPHLPTALTCETNFALNGYERGKHYRLVTAAASDECGKTWLRCYPRSMHNTILEDAPQGSHNHMQPTPIVTLDSQLEGKHVDMVKIDVQGAELKVLDGMRGVLAVNPTLELLIEVHGGYGVTVEQVQEKLRDYPDVKVIL